MISPTKIRDDIRQLLALAELRECIAPSDRPTSLHWFRRGDVELMDLLDERIARLQAEIGAKR